METNNFNQKEQDQTLLLERELEQLRQRIAELERENYLLKHQHPTKAQQEFNRIKQVITHSTSAITILRGPNHIVELANPAYQQVIGRSKSIEGMPLMQALPELEGQGFKELLDEVYRSGQPFFSKEMAARLDVKQDGKVEDVFFNFIYHPLLSIEGEVEGVFIHATNITDQVRARQALEQERSKLQEILRNAPAAIATLSVPNYKFELTNASYMHMIGRQNSLIGLSVREVLPKIEEQGFVGILDRVCQTGEPFVGQEIPILLDSKGDGNLHQTFINFVNQPIFAPDGSGKIEGIFVHAVDVTEQVQARQALEQERQRLKEVFVNAPAAIATLRVPGYVFELANAPYMRLIGRQNPIVGLSLLEALPELENQGFIELLDKVCQTGEPLVAQEMSAQLDPNGDGNIEQIFVNFVYQPLFASDGSGNIEGIFAHVIDVTEQVEARKQIEELSRLKDEFLAIASHDLRTPVTSIKGYLQLLQRNLLKQQSQQPTNTGDGVAQFLENASKSVTTVLNQTNRLHELLNRLLDFSQITQNQLSLRRTPDADLAKLVQEVVANLSITTQDHQLVIQSLPTASIKLSYDEARIEQVLNNLVGNAIKYSPADTIITVGIELPQTEPKEVIVWVRDQGYGISLAQHTNLFERFYRVRNEQTERKSGLGLGLYISSQIVKQHEGRLWVESTEGQGSTFYLALPISKE